jgi:hypothetical protein
MGIEYVIATNDRLDNRKYGRVARLGVIFVQFDAPFDRRATFSQSDRSFRKFRETDHGHVG